MTATPAEVLRSLPPELSAAPDGGVLEGVDGPRRWRLEIAAAAPKRLGAMELPVTELLIRLSGYTEEQRARFMARLEACTRRGGG